MRNENTAMHIPDGRQSETILRTPTADDGPSVHQLISRCPPLDENSVYCNLLQCTHWASTCVIAETADEADESGKKTPGGFISGYLLPEDANTLFIWQVAVDRTMRGKGLAGKMLRAILARDACRTVSHLQTTINPSNQASWKLFEKLAQDLGADMQRRTLFDASQFSDDHEEEVLLTIGPFDPSCLRD
ncbi:Histone acetyltransferase HPA2/related acetyltransferase [Hahella chejuensis KCTC 2396]|uniref:L-2,4-diaminobutyric acid acetyltransferase n=2 Tax=Hahella chejuensis TaxID=158327 RepID=Q2SLV6_HAHCH|nr:Histone acetyltransferase HPA2/related acetyltransferase [Hahella chejuensis KCTC 2396]